MLNLVKFTRLYRPPFVLIASAIRLYNQGVKLEVKATAAKGGSTEILVKKSERRILAKVGL
ncbi:hypothetical protein [Mucilaginibacter sp.]|uniref:hypothetical protein n=1 Tax=Mucilaginibacter sp. TaxID=1882438 RepID=UPI0025F3D1B7|nr:hypothetical protein [Mucilaginibacter sp.]